MTDLLDLGSLIRLARDTVSDPKAGAEYVLRMGLGVSREALWLCFALTVVGSLFIGELVGLLIPQPEFGPLTGRSAFSLG